MTMGNLKEESIRTILRKVRSEGHPYVELRQDGNKLIFFCVLCLMPCYGDSNLYNHLKGKRHTERLAAAKRTLMKTNPWPFNDGLFFFHDDSEEKYKNLPVSGSQRVNLANISYGDANSCFPQDRDEVPGDSNLDCDGTVSGLVIPGVLQKDEMSDLVVRLTGVGLIGARFSEKDEVSNEIGKIWCEWLGSKASTNVVPEHDFAVVTFAYNYNLGRQRLIDVFKPESILSKTMRKKLRDQQHIASQRTCDICQQKMLPDKDVACLVNRRTRKLVCSTRNLIGAFHVFHISCLINWILHCEVEIYKNQSAEPKVEGESRNQIHSALCPECQGTGSITIDAGEIPVSLHEIFNMKIELINAHIAWRKSPEMLQNCSLGFSLPLQSDEIYQENVVYLKLLHFYRAQISD